MIVSRRRGVAGPAGSCVITPVGLRVFILGGPSLHLKLLVPCGSLVLAFSVIAAPRVGQAQAPEPAPSARPAKTWHASGALHATERADNNVFLLSDARIAQVDTLTAPAPPTTRFADMQSASDFITAVRAELGAAGPGLFGRSLSLRLGAGYDFYARNDKRRHVALRFSIAQAFPHHGRLQLRGRLTPSYFFRNFLADAIDLNADGRIESNERIYAAGTYRDSRILLGYRQELVRARHGRPFGAAVELEVGHIDRRYDAPLHYRSYNGPMVGAALALDFSRSVALELGYTHASLNSQPDSAVLVLNEPDFNHDFNGDGTATDLRVRTVQLVDFSRTEQDVNVRLRVGRADGVRLGAHYRHRWRTFPSTQPFDVYNNTRRDHRDFVGLELIVPTGPRTAFVVGGDTETQIVARSLVPNLTSAGTDYSRRRLFAGWRYHF
jgi:hypothetical protein